MHILILEDNPNRIEFFKRIYKNHDLYITKDLDDAQQTVTYNEIDIMFLDHDLEYNNLQAVKEERTGYEFVKYLVLNELQKHAVIYVHSMNPVGGQAMTTLLRDNGYEAQWIPFHLLKIEDR